MFERKQRSTILIFRGRSKCLNSPMEVSSNPCTRDVTHEGAGEQVTVKTTLMNLIKGVDVDPRRRSERLTTLRGGDPIILAFDEAHALTGREKVENQNSLQQWSLFSEFRRALRDLNESPIFSLFLSTTGKVSQFSARKADDPSRRVQLGLASLIVPFTDLGFDQFAKPIKTDGSTLLDTIASDQHMVTLGRPL